MTISELIFVFGVIYGLKFISYVYEFLFVERLFAEIYLKLYRKSVDYICIGLFLNSILVQIDQFAYLEDNRLTDYCSFMINSKVRWKKSVLFFFPKVILAILILLYF